MFGAAQLAHFLKKTPLLPVMAAVDNWRSDRRGWRQGSYAQHGEDQFVLDYFNGKPGTYVDIGANHPIKISNTYLLYRNGWSGLTVEPIDRLAGAHRKYRPRDVLEQVLVGPSGRMAFYQMHGTGHSTVVSDRALDRAAVERVIELEVVPLADLIDRHLRNRSIELLSVDTEGYDLQVLKSGDWKRHRPQLVIYESEEYETEAEREINAFMTSWGYRVLRRLGCNIVLERSKDA